MGNMKMSAAQMYRIHRLEQYSTAIAEDPDNVVLQSIVSCMQSVHEEMCELEHLLVELDEENVR